MASAKNLKSYHRDISEALKDDFLSRAMDNFAVAYRQSRQKAFTGRDLEGWIGEIATLKDQSLKHLDDLLDEFTAHATAAGVRVHRAENAEAANRIIAEIAQENQVFRIIKSKSMTAEETHLNAHLEAQGFQVTETDLGEWIIQLRGEGPSHMVMPAIHLSRRQVADLFASVTGHSQSDEIQQLVKVARRQLRETFVRADMGISGANFAVADSGAIGLVTNEGNARLVTTLPRVHVALVGLEKLVPTLADALKILRILPRNATGQALTSYVTWINGANECASAADRRKVMHIVFLDNGRRALAQDPEFVQVLRCVRCGACANVCPIYRMVGGHRYGHVYIGAIGLILTYFFHGRGQARHLVQNCINCGACQEVCAAGIELPKLIKAIHARIQNEEGHPIANQMLAKVLRHRRLFHSLLRSARVAQMPVSANTPYLRHLPMLFDKAHNDRMLPAVAPKAFREMWPRIRPLVKSPRLRVALFAGCLQDFVYPEQLEAALKILAGSDVAVEFPMGQSCCGLPLEMMGEVDAAREVAVMNLDAMAPDRFDHIITLCASCASHLKLGYPATLKDHPAAAGKLNAFSQKVLPWSVFLNRKLKLSPRPLKLNAKKVAFHSPCHLCRALKVTTDPRNLIADTGNEFVKTAEEQTCCGFGGTYANKFPEISARILTRKLEDVRQSGADILVTECPGCVMQLRGGAVKQKAPFVVMHLSELLADGLK